MPLPFITFLYGPSTPAKRELANLLCEHDPALLPFDLYEPLRSALLQLFFDGFTLHNELTPDRLAEPNPITPSLTNADWQNELERMLRDVDKAILGKIFVHNLQADPPNISFDRILIRDAIEHHDVRFISQSYPARTIIIQTAFHLPLQLPTLRVDLDALSPAAAVQYILDSISRAPAIQEPSQ